MQKILLSEDKPALHAQLVKESEAENMYAGIGLISCSILFLYYLYVMWKESRDEGSDISDKIAETSVAAIKDGKLTLRGAMSHFRDRNWNALHDERDELEAVLLNKRSMDEVRRMCKVLAPFFSQYDLDGNGTIDFDEFRMVFRDVNENLSKDNQRVMFDAADTDKSGCISFEEFVACMMSFALDSSHDLTDDGKSGAKYITASQVQNTLDNDNEKQGGDDEDDDDEGEEEEDVPEDLADLSPADQQKAILRRSFFHDGLRDCDGAGLL